MGEAPDVPSGVAALHATLCEHALRRGLLAGYHTIEDHLHTVRGRIDLAEQLRRRPGLDLPLAVRFEEHDEDTTENRLLLSATQLLRRLPIRNHHTQRTLHRLSEALQHVTPIAFPPTAVPVITWTRLNAHSRAAVELARLLLRLRTVDLTPGATATAALTIDMAALFEEFVRIGAARSPPGHTHSVPHRIRHPTTGAGRARPHPPRTRPELLDPRPVHLHRGCEIQAGHRSRTQR